MCRNILTHHTKHIPVIFKILFIKRFGEDVCNLVLCSIYLSLIPLFCTFDKQMLMYLIVFVLNIKNWIFCQLYSFIYFLTEWFWSTRASGNYSILDLQWTEMSDHTMKFTVWLWLHKLGVSILPKLPRACTCPLHLFFTTIGTHEHGHVTRETWILEGQ